MRFASKPTVQGRQVRLDKRHSLSGESAKRTLIAAMAGRVVLDRRFVVVDLNAELGGVAKERLKLGGDRRIIGAGEGRRGKSRRRRGGEKLNDERKRNDKCGQRRAERPQAALRAPRPKRKCLATEAHQNTLRCFNLVTERSREGNSLRPSRGRQLPAASGKVGHDGPAGHCR
jgi:hypothetical protein